MKRREGKLIIVGVAYGGQWEWHTLYSGRGQYSTWGYVMGASLFSFSFSIVSLSSLRSSFVPTKMIGVLGQWWLTSGYHYSDKKKKQDKEVWPKKIQSNNNKHLLLHGHSQRTQGWPKRSRSRIRPEWRERITLLDGNFIDLLSVGRIVDVAGRNLLDLWTEEGIIGSQIWSHDLSPAVSHNPRFMGFPSTITFAE